MVIVVQALVVLMMSTLAADQPADAGSFGRAAGTQATFYGIEYVWIPAGQFVMGAPAGQSGVDDDEQPQHLVTFSRGFWLSRHEITNAQFCVFLNDQGNQVMAGIAWLEIDDPNCRIQHNAGQFVSLPGFAQHPATEMSWWAAQTYAKWSGILSTLIQM